MFVDIVGHWLTRKLCTYIIKISEGHAGKDMRLKLVIIDHAIEHMSRTCTYFPLKRASESTLMPSCSQADDRKHHMVLADQVVLLTRECNNTIVQILRRTVTILLNVAIVGNLIRLVDFQLSTRLLVWHDSKKIAIALGISGESLTSKISLDGRVKPSFVVLHSRFLLRGVEQVECKSHGLTAIRIDRLDGHRCKNSLASIHFLVGGEHIRGICKLNNNTILHLLSSSIGLEHNARCVSILGDSFIPISIEAKGVSADCFASVLSCSAALNLRHISMHKMQTLI